MVQLLSRQLSFKVFRLMSLKQILGFRPAHCLFTKQDSSLSDSFKYNISGLPEVKQLERETALNTGHTGI